MNKEEKEMFEKCVKVLILISDRLETVFKAVEGIQKHIINKEKL